MNQVPVVKKLNSFGHFETYFVCLVVRKVSFSNLVLVSQVQFVKKVKNQIDLSNSLTVFRQEKKSGGSKIFVSKPHGKFRLDALFPQPDI